MEQGTNEWHMARAGLVTASRIGDLMARTKSGYAASRANYMAELIVERMTGVPNEGFTNAAMRWGTETEPFAREAHEIISGCLVNEIGFCRHPTLEAGASPDGLIGDDGLIEIKCPNTSTHINTLLTGKIDKKYMLQMQFQMLCTERDWCDFVSYDPRMPEGLTYWCKRVEADRKAWTEINEAVDAFLVELRTKVEALEKLAA